MYSTRKSLISLTSILVLMLLTTITHAATLNVPSQYSRLQKAIDAALPGDTIVVAAGVYNDLPPTVWYGKDLIIKGAGPGKTTLSTNGEGRCLYTENLTAASRIEGFSFVNGLQSAGGGMA